MRKISATSLQNSALYYLKRYSASEQRLRQVLLRKAARLNREKGESVDAVPLIDELLVKLRGLGYLNDERLAEQQADALRRAGKSTRAIRFKLQTKGLKAQADTASRRGNDDDAIWQFAKRKKLGPFTRTGNRAELRQKQLATLARAGFAFALAKKVVDAAEAPDVPRE